VKRSFASKSYRDNDGTSANDPHDYAIVRLKRSVDVATRTVAQGSAALGRPFVVRGYPGELGYDGTLMYESRDRIRAILSNGVFQHRASTTGGMSGAGIDDGTNVVGVHTSGPPGGYNTGVVFSPESLANVREWAMLSL
jgi:V8-like Glu-specific endopeptidase